MDTKTRKIINSEFRGVSYKTGMHFEKDEPRKSSSEYYNDVYADAEWDDPEPVCDCGWCD